jgi:hypothetical protein
VLAGVAVGSGDGVGVVLGVASLSGVTVFVAVLTGVGVSGKRVGVAVGIDWVADSWLVVAGML